jgi:trehalose 6-phosphate phosphatase
MGHPDAAADPRRPFMSDRATAAVLTDFDGTLAGIVDDPSQAAPVPGALETLRLLVGEFGMVGVISGRPVSFLVTQLGSIEGIHLAGLYGLEQAVGDRIESHPLALPWMSALEAAANDAESAAPAGVRVERKGLAVTLHVRTAPHNAAWIEAFARHQAETRGLHAHPGRLSVELRPPIGVDKGTVVEEMARNRRAVCYCGDDVGDLPAFAALARLRTQGVATLGVAAMSDESPDDLAAAADVCVDGPSGVVSFLSTLL